MGIIFGGMGSITGGFDSEDLAGSIRFTAAAQHSRIYASANASLETWLKHENITYNAHKAGIGPETAAQNKGLMEVFNVVTTETDRKGKAFVAQIEGKTLPIYGNQFHPEKIQFVHSSMYHNIPRTAHAVAGARHYAQFL